MANKKTGKKFRYSITSYKVTMGKNSGKVMYHPTAQLSGTIDLPKLAQHMSEHDSKYNEGDIYAVLVQAVKCIKEFGAQGVAVQLGDLGQFVPKIRTTSQLSSEDVSAADIRRVTLRGWTSPVGSWMSPSPSMTSCRRLKSSSRKSRRCLTLPSKTWRKPPPKTTTP